MNTLNISLVIFGVFVWVIAVIAVRHDKKIRGRHKAKGRFKGSAV